MSMMKSASLPVHPTLAWRGALWRALPGLLLAWWTAAPMAAPAGETLAPVPLDASLLGCWRAERVEQVLVGGGSWTDVGGCTLKFDTDTIVSACVLRPGNQPIRYSYRISEPGVYRARTTRHPQRPEAEGSERDFAYRIEGDRLYITSYPQSAMPATPNVAVRVDSVSVRVGSRTDLKGPDDREKAGCEGRIASNPKTPGEIRRETVSVGMRQAAEPAAWRRMATAIPDD